MKNLPAHGDVHAWTKPPQPQDNINSLLARVVLDGADFVEMSTTAPARISELGPTESGMRDALEKISAKILRDTNSTVL